MKHNIIKTPEYLLIVDDSEIKDVRPYKGKWQLEQGNILNRFPTYLTDLSECKIVIAYLPLNNSPILEGVPLLPPLEDEDDVERLAMIETQKKFKLEHIPLQQIDEYGGIVKEFSSRWKQGYNKAKEKYKYTEEDIKIAIQQAFLSGVERLEDFEKVEKMILENIKSLSQPKTPTHFEFEMEKQFEYRKTTNNCITGFTSLPYPTNEVKPRTTTDSQGQTQLVGRYIFN